GAVAAAATGRPLADYCAETIWGPAGMEANGYWLLESEGGLEWGGFGVSACLRDVGRFGQLVLEDGEAFSGRRVLPLGWRDLAGQPDSAPTAFGRLMLWRRCTLALWFVRNGTDNVIGSGPSQCTLNHLPAPQWGVGQTASAYLKPYWSGDGPPQALPLQPPAGGRLHAQDG